MSLLYLLDLNETLKTALEVIILKELMHKLQTFFLIEEKKQVLQSIASLGQDHLDEYEIPLPRWSYG